MSKGFIPGNPNGWGDPGPLVLLLLALVFMGAALDRLNLSTSEDQRCRQLLEQQQLQ